MEQLIAFLFIMGIVYLMIIYSAMVLGFVLFKFYYWFLLPVFDLAPHINYWQAIGLILIVGLFKSESHPLHVKIIMRIQRL